MLHASCPARGWYPVSARGATGDEAASDMAAAPLRPLRPRRRARRARYGPRTKDWRPDSEGRPVIRFGGDSPHRRASPGLPARLYKRRAPLWREPLQGSGQSAVASTASGAGGS